MINVDDSVTPNRKTNGADLLNAAGDGFAVRRARLSLWHEGSLIIVSASVPFALLNWPRLIKLHIGRRRCCIRQTAVRECRQRSADKTTSSSLEDLFRTENTYG